MTTVDEGTEPTADERSDETTVAAATAVTSDEGRRWFAAELLLALEMAGLGAFAFSRSVLDSFGRSPHTFVARGADGTTVVLFGLVVAFIPIVILALVGLGGRPFGATARGRVHLALVAVVGGLAIWQIGQSITGYPPESQKLMIAGTIGGIALAVLRAKRPTTGTYLRFMGVASVLFLVQFLFLSPSSALVTGGEPELDAEVAADVAADLGDAPPDVVVVVFDALPTMSLLDGTGQVDATLYPNFARLAATSDWYRNNTSVAAFTGQAVPALMTGRYRPLGDAGGFSPDDDKNVFTLLGGVYDLHVREAITRMCPDELCPRPNKPGLDELLGDAVALWSGGAGDRAAFDLPGALGEDRYERATDWIDELEMTPNQPDLVFHHAVMPHGPWYLTPEGEPYEAANRRPTGSYGLGWTRAGVTVAEQRHLLQLQASDRLLGQLLDKLEAEGSFDDSVVVVTADHGESFVPDTLMRGLTEDNIAHIMWTPLFVKAPGQTQPRIDDANVNALDVLPTLADVLGVDLPWDVDGGPVAEADERDDDKSFQEHSSNGLHPDDEDDAVFEVEDAADRFADVLAYDATPFDDADAIWRRTAHGGLVGLAVDDLAVGDAADADVDVQRLDDIRDSRPRRPLIEVVGQADLPVGATVAYAMNGTIGAVTTAEPAYRPDADWTLVHGLLPPRLFAEGDNELTAYVVEGEIGAEVLRPLAVDHAD